MPAPDTAALGLGLAALARPGYITLGHGADLEGNYDVAAMERRTHAVLDAARAAGVNWFDAARSYGRSEEFLARWLAARGLMPGEVSVSSKWGYRYVANWQVDVEKHEIKDHGLPALERQIAESRAHLGQHLSLYQVHSATLESGILEDERVLARLAELRDAGLPIGLSLSGPRQRATLERALGVEIAGRPLFSAVQATWNLLERAVEPALRAAKSAGLRVLIKEAVANGRLTHRAAPASLREEAARLHVTPDAVALAAALAQPFVDIVLSGAVTPTQLAQNLNARTLDGSDLAERLQSLTEPPERYWSERSKLAWN